MLQPRMIPTLLLSGDGFYKTTKFKNPVYLGDPLNILKIFNEKEVDELLILDIAATPKKLKPNFKLLHQMASECFMPLGYGGGITSLEEMTKAFDCGIEKICINTKSHTDIELLSDAANQYGSQSIVVFIDVKKSVFGRYTMFSNGGRKRVSKPLEKHILDCESAGAGEIIINSIDRDGTMLGYDIPLISKVASSLTIPVVASGGAGTVEHLQSAISLGGASAVAAGSMFVYKGPRRAVLINVPKIDLSAQ